MILIESKGRFQYMVFRKRKSGKVSRDLGKELNITGVYGREIEGGAGILLDIPLDHSKELKGLTLETLSNDVVIGIMGITLQ